MNKKENDKWTAIICVTIILISIVAIKSFEGETPKTDNQTPLTTSSTASKTTSKTATPSSDTSPSVGDNAYLRLPDNNDPNNKIALGMTAEDAGLITKALIAQDFMGIYELTSQGKAFAISNGSKVLIIDSSVGLRKVRIVSGVQSIDNDKVGMAGWVPMEWVVKN